RLEALEGHLESFGARLEDESSKALDEVGQRLDRSAVFGVFDGDVLAGVAGWYAMPGAKQAHRGALWGMYVRPGHRHRGIGKMLVDQVIDDATGTVEQMHLSVVVGNTAAMGLYKSTGFTSYGVEPHAAKIGDTYVDEVLMVRPLP
ncbi:MAG: GNAT family N-acetyltransferase, partial [Rhodospirillaceae bacterium]|nr:GNAT family N-acetyltransferase [Rhodospirillaceae bacterium]